MSRALGVDVGTMFFQTAEMKGDNEISYQTIRNAFIELDASEETQEALANNNWQYIYDESEKKYYILGEDSLKMAKMFPGKVELRRPLKDGVLNKGETKKMLVLANMVERSLGSPVSDFDTVTTCVSSKSLDSSSDSSFHRSRLQGIFTNAGWKNVNVIEEGHAVILSENPTMTEEDGSESKYSGLGISMGAGRCNFVLAYKGKQIIGGSVATSGDWIDQKVSEATDTPVSQVIGVKERDLDFNKMDLENDVIFALDVYYGEMLKKVFSNFAREFKSVKSQFPGDVEVVIAGGTSTVPGMIKKIERVVSDLDLPFGIKIIRRASDPRNAVVRGCMTHAIVSSNKKQKEAQSRPKEEMVKKEEKVVDTKKNIEDLEAEFG